MKLKFELVNGYGILVDEEAEIKEGEWAIEMYNGQSQAVNPLKFTDENGNNWFVRKMNMYCGKNDHEAHKIIFAEKELKLEGVPVFEWRDFEPNEKSLLSMFYNVCKATYPEFDEWIEAKEYKKWLEKSNPAKYTEEDLQKAFHAGEERILKREYEKGLSELDSYTNLKKSLQKYPQYVVMENNTVKELIWE
jgi:hypothetical protein